MVSIKLIGQSCVVARVRSTSATLAGSNSFSMQEAPTHGPTKQHAHCCLLPRPTSKEDCCVIELDRSQEKASAEIRGAFSRTKFQVTFAGDFLVDLFGPFSSEIPRRGRSQAFTRGALRKFVANCVPNLRKNAGVSIFCTSHEGCAKLSQIRQSVSNNCMQINTPFPRPLS